MTPDHVTPGHVTPDHVTPDHVTIVVKCCSDKWKAMGRVLLECENTGVLNVVTLSDSNEEKLRSVIGQWLKQTEEATVSQLIQACGHPEVNCQGIVKRKLKEKHLVDT